MKWNGFFLLSALAVCSPLAADAQDREARLTTAMPSPLKRSVYVHPTETRFSGSAEVTGTVEVSWVQPGEGYPGYRVVFRPGAESLKILPHEARRGPAREIWIRNPDEALAALTTPALTRTIRGSTRRLSTSATLVIRSYRTAVDCDVRSYSALFDSVVGAPGALTAGRAPDDVPSC